jgi:hypothetical protein
MARPQVLLREDSCWTSLPLPRASDWEHFSHIESQGLPRGRQSKTGPKAQGREEGVAKVRVCAAIHPLPEADLGVLATG